jgi:hypothetical protein
MCVKLPFPNAAETMTDKARPFVLGQPPPNPDATLHLVPDSEVHSVLSHAVMSCTWLVVSPNFTVALEPNNPKAQPTTTNDVPEEGPFVIMLLSLTLAMS